MILAEEEQTEAEPLLAIRIEKGAATARTSMAEEVKVMGAWISPFSHRVQLALKLKGVPYEYIEEDLANKSPLLLKYNPIHKKVPVLVHNEKIIPESAIILEYIDETWKGYSLIPEEPYERAMARFWVKFIDEKCGPAVWIASWSEGKEQEKAMEEAWEHLRTLENELKGKTFFGGESIGIVDIAADSIGLCIGILQEVTGMKLLVEAKFPILCRWIEQFLCIDVVKECLPPRDEMLMYLQGRKEAITASKNYGL